MTQDQIIEWAEKSRLQVKSERGWIDTNYLERLTAFANLVAQHQKEQDAAMVKAGCGYNWDEIAAAIRSQE